MKKNILLLILAMFYSAINAQTWSWGKQARDTGTGSQNRASSVATDRKGNVYVSGVIGGTSMCIFDTDTLTCKHQGYDFYLAKYDSSGSFKWVIQATTSKFSLFNTYSIASDINGNIYLTGEYNDTLSFGGHTLTSQSSGNIFLAKINSSGKVLWFENPTNSNSGQCAPHSITTDVKSNVYIVGQFTNTVSFGSDTLITKAKSTNIFTVKCDSAGNTLWAEEANVQSGASSVIGSSVSVNADEIYVTGYFKDTIEFGSSTLVGGKYDQFFLVKYDSGGIMKWATQSYGGSSYGNSVATDNSGAVYIVGSFIDTTVFGHDTVFSISTSDDIFICKYTSGGNEIWTRQADVLDGMYWNVNSISIDSYNNIYVSSSTTPVGFNTGHFEVKYGSDTFNVQPVYNAEGDFLLKIDTSGNLECGTINIEAIGVDIVANPFGRGAYCVGYIEDTTILGPNTLIADGYGMYTSIAKWQGCDNIVAGINTPVPNKSLIRVYPNPNNGVFMIDLSAVSYKTQLEVFNILGERVFTMPLQHIQSDTEIDLSFQPVGMYLYWVISEKGDFVGSGKFVIEK